MAPADIVIPGLHHGSYETFAAASARYYHAPLGPQPSHWDYSKYRGILVFGKNTGAKALAPSATSPPDDTYWFRLLVPNSGELKTVWMFKVFTDLNYQVEKPFFHVIHGLTRRYGFLFDYDDAAIGFADQVRSNYVPPPSEKRFYSKSLSRRETRSRSKSHPPNLVSNRSQTITAPVTESFRHIMHVGFNRRVLEKTGEKAPEVAWQDMPPFRSGQSLGLAHPGISTESR
ncbi:hypothetical protein APHAL10511_007226 [Amanita phalloides]|nr:hypothetical protein APHAL10511_007226 [Amanita phalloides]